LHILVSSETLEMMDSIPGQTR